MPKYSIPIEFREGLVNFIQKLYGLLEKTEPLNLPPMVKADDLRTLLLTKFANNAETKFVEDFYNMAVRLLQLADEVHSRENFFDLKNISWKSLISALFWNPSLSATVGRLNSFRADSKKLYRKESTVDTRVKKVFNADLFWVDFLTKFENGEFTGELKTDQNAIHVLLEREGMSYTIARKKQKTYTYDWALRVHSEYDSEINTVISNLNVLSENLLRSPRYIQSMSVQKQFNAKVQALDYLSRESGKSSLNEVEKIFREISTAFAELTTLKENLMQQTQEELSYLQGSLTAIESKIEQTLGYDSDLIQQYKNKLIVKIKDKPEVNLFFLDIIDRRYEDACNNYTDAAMKYKFLTVRDSALGSSEENSETASGSEVEEFLLEVGPVTPALVEESIPVIAITVVEVDKPKEVAYKEYVCEIEPAPAESLKFSRNNAPRGREFSWETFMLNANYDDLGPVPLIRHPDELAKEKILEQVELYVKSISAWNSQYYSKYTDFSVEDVKKGLNELLEIPGAPEVRIKAILEKQIPKLAAGLGIFYSASYVFSKKINEFNETLKNSSPEERLAFLYEIKNEIKKSNLNHEAKAGFFKKCDAIADDLEKLEGKKSVALANQAALFKASPASTKSKSKPLDPTLALWRGM